MKAQSKQRTTIASFAYMWDDSKQEEIRAKKEKQHLIHAKALGKSLSPGRLAKNKRRRERKLQWKLDAKLRIIK